MPDNRLTLDWIDPFQPDAAPRIRERIREIDEWIDYTLDHCDGPAAGAILCAKRAYTRALRVAEAAGGDKYALAAELLEDSHA